MLEPTLPSLEERLQTDCAALVEALKAVIQNGGKVAIAFDADKPGELMAWRIAQHLLEVNRLLPTKGKDWNEQLIGPAQPAPHRQKFSVLWKWYQAASTIGHPEKYADRIREIAVPSSTAKHYPTRLKRLCSKT